MEEGERRCGAGGIAALVGNDERKRALEADLMRCGWSLSMVGAGLSWWSVFAFADHRRPHDSLTSVTNPEQHMWGLAELLLAKLVGAKPGNGDGGATETHVDSFGEATDRDEIENDPWFWPVGGNTIT